MKVLHAIMLAYQNIRLKLNSSSSELSENSISDLNSQLDYLFYVGFLCDIDSTQLTNYRRYLSAIEKRIEKAILQPGKDLERIQQLSAHWDIYRRYDEWFSQRDIQPQALLDFHWHIEEYRIQLFCQELRAQFKVSQKNLDHYAQQLKHKQEEIKADF